MINYITTTCLYQHTRAAVPTMQANLKIILLIQLAFANSAELKNCPKDTSWPGGTGIFELCSKNDGYCSRCPLNFQKCFKEEGNGSDHECLVCMNTATSVHINYYNVRKCEKPGPYSKVIVISVNQVAKTLAPHSFKYFGKAWKDTRALPT